MSVLERFSLKGRIAVVTGGAGMYGRQIVAALSEAGAVVFIAARSLSRLEALAQEGRSRGVDIRAIRYDQADEGSVLQLRDRVLESAGAVHILVNNAVARPMQGYGDNLGRFAESMQVNATGLFAVTRAFGDVMAAAGSGSILNIGSIRGMVAPDEWLFAGTSLSGWYPDYAFHKGGMINFTRFVASYYGASNVRANCISAGSFWVEEPPAAFVRQYSERTMLGRLANDTDLQGVVVFLASDASAYITGANIPVDGGYTGK